MNIKTFLLTLFLLTTSLFSQTPQQPKQWKILGISVSGNISAEPSAIIANSGLNIGDMITIPGEQTRNAVVRLWELNIFSDIKIEIENTVNDGVYLVINVKENPRLGKIEIEGEDELSETDILKKINLVKGQVITPQELNKSIKEIKKEYEKEGYLQTSITTETTEITNDSTLKGKYLLRFIIDEGNEVTVSSIQFYGNKNFSDDDLKDEFSDTHEKVWWKFWRSSKLDKKKYEEDKKKIVQFYRKNGYRDAELISDSLQVNDDKETLTLKLFVYEGKQYKIRNIVWEGNTVVTNAELNARLGIQPGEIYNAEKLERNLRGNEEQTDVSSRYLDNGYLMVNIEPEEQKVGEDSVDITIQIRERNQFKVAKVEIRGNNKTQEKVIRRELYTRPADYFSRAAIIRSIRQLSVLNYFNPERIKPDTRFVDDKTVDVVFDVEEKSSDTFNMSVGYSEAYGFTGALGVTFNNFSLAHPLSGGGGQILNFDWQFGVDNQYRTFSISFKEPWLFDTPTSAGFSVYDSKYNYGYSVSQRGGTLSLGRRFKFPDDFFSGNWIFRVQQIESNSAYFLSGSQFSITQIISRNSINNPLFPTQGSNVSLSTEFSGPPLLPGRAEYTKHIFSLDWYTPAFNNQKFAFYIGSQIGTILSLGNKLDIPPLEYFYMGGTGLGQASVTPLRGYDDRVIGPFNTTLGTQGGTVMAKHTAELRFNVALNPIPIYLLTFAEAGNVWSDISKTEIFELKRAAGIGARLLINPIGLLGFDYGYGFDAVTKDGDPSGWKFQFQFGRGF